MTPDKESPAGQENQHGPEKPRQKGDPSGRKLAEISTDLHEEVLHERDEYLESLQRLQAEFANFRKRVLRDSEQQTKRASSEVIEELLPVLDNFERAMQAAAQHDEKLLTDGVELVYNQLRGILTRRGLCEIEAEGETFDPNQHEAVLCQPSGKHEEGTVIQVLEKGYQLEDKVVRPAKVIVSTTPDENDTPGKGDGPKSS
ncbi:MAG: nucleotide exchange factor GrpE [Thermoleophilia bacterium]